MPNEKQELLNKLLMKIEFDKGEYPIVFDEAELEKVIVHKDSDKWDFVIKTNKQVPFLAYIDLSHKLKENFNTVKQVNLVLERNDKDVTESVIQEYIRGFIQIMINDNPMYRQLLTDNNVKYGSARTEIYFDNGFEEEVFKSDVLPEIKQKLAEVNIEYDNFFVKLYQKEVQNNSDLKEIIDNATKQIINKKKATKNVSGNNRLKSSIITGRKISSNDFTQIKEIEEEDRGVVIKGNIFDIDVKDLKSGRKLLLLKLTDYSSSIEIKKFSNSSEDESGFAALSVGDWITVRGNVQEDNFSHALVMMANDINLTEHEEKQDLSVEKRVELHTHSNMSQMDSSTKVTDYVKAAKQYGHKAVAITDNSSVQAFPDAYAAAKEKGIKPIFGVEINLVDDETKIVINDNDQPLSGTEFVIFDIETTGLSAVYDSIIEIGAVKMVDGKVVDKFQEFIDPGFPLSETTTNLTGITDDMVHGAMNVQDALNKFKQFIGNDPVIGHNVSFDAGFINHGFKEFGMDPLSAPIIDTLELSRVINSDLKNHKLDTLTKKFKISLDNHHRADADAAATGMLWYALLDKFLKKYPVDKISQLNGAATDPNRYKQVRPTQLILLAQNNGGLKNMFRIVSSAMTDYFYRVPRVPISVLKENQSGLLLGSASSQSDVFVSMMQKGYEATIPLAEKYDYLEVQPLAAYEPLILSDMIKDKNQLKEIIKNLYKLSKELAIPMVATGDVHYIDSSEAIYRKILVSSMGGANPLNRGPLPDLPFYTTDEMLQQFSFLGKDVAKEIVIENSNKIADMIDEVVPVKDKLYTPKMPHDKEMINDLAINRAKELYGENLPEIVQKRLNKELNSIISNGFAVIYLISQKLVYKSNKDGYLVGSRGSVGSSFVATMTGITEVNPLPPHYRCGNCYYSEFFPNGEVGSGFDLPDKDCPNCGAPLFKDGHDIPFETFLGFKGDKVPDIDLNFSGVYQPIAHNYTKVLFGENNVFRAGTISTVAQKTAYGYVKGYERDNDKIFPPAEIDRLAKGVEGAKRTSGQHPAGIIVVPDYMDIFDFTPIQYPADDRSSSWKTTHFDFHSIHDNILKLDILGHDDPTMIRMLQDLSGIDPQSIPTDDPGVMALFQGTTSLGVTPEAIGSKVGTLGIPEFGTKFVRGMLEETHPSSFSELLQISGLSHGTDVWLGNAEELIQNNEVTLKEVIGCRDNIMMDLIHWGIEPDIAFQIMEKVRKGKGVPEEWQNLMRENENIPDWYIESCQKIKYMFPKAHATAYILMALRIAYFKVYFPIIYYTAYFSVRAEDFDLVAMSKGAEAVKARIKEIRDLGNEASTKDKNLLTVLEIANESIERGISIKMVDIDKSEAFDFKIEGNSIIAPFIALPGLGENVAKQIVAAREEKPFLSKEDLSKRGKVSKGLIEYLTVNHVIDDLPDQNQLSLF